MRSVENGSPLGLPVKMVILAAAYSWSFIEICLLAKLILKHRSKIKECY